MAGRRGYERWALSGSLAILLSSERQMKLS